MVDHFLPEGATAEGLRHVTYEERGNFVDQPYAWEIDEGSAGVSVRLWREGTLRQEDRQTPVRVEKRLEVSPGVEALTVRYTVTNLGEDAALGTFAPEWNLNLLGGGGNPSAFLHIRGESEERVRLDSAGEMSGVERLSMGNEHLGIRMDLRLGEKAALWWYPIETVSNSEGGVERTYQGTCLITPIRFSLEPGARLEMRFEWLFS